MFQCGVLDILLIVEFQGYFYYAWFQYDLFIGKKFQYFRFYVLNIFGYLIESLEIIRKLILELEIKEDIFVSIELKMCYYDFFFF